LQAGGVESFEQAMRLSAALISPLGKGIDQPESNGIHVKTGWK
jgi:hypothetical protein